MKAILLLVLVLSASNASAALKVLKKDIVLSSVSSYDPALYLSLITEFNTAAIGYTQEYLMKMCPAGSRLIAKTIDYCRADPNRTSKRDLCFSNDSDHNLFSEPLNLGALSFVTETAGQVFYILDIDRTDGKPRPEPQLMDSFNPLHYLRTTLVVDVPSGNCSL